jgi:hypothetical protein
MSRPVLVVGLVSLLLPAACAHMTAPARNGGPTRSVEGVALALARESCDQTREPGWHGLDLTELTLEIEVRNPTATPLAILRKNMRLVTPDGGALKTSTFGAGSPLDVAGGETKTFEVRFQSRGALACAAELRLDTDGSVTAGAKPLATDGITFTPSSAASAAL